MASSPLKDFAGKRVAVVGDVMLDEFLRGDVARISPEAPVPVVEVRSRAMTLGGAANVAANVASLGGRASLVGMIGDDPAGQAVRSLIERAAIEGGGLVASAARPTTRKTRIVARNQQIARIDEESREELGVHDRQALVAAARERVAEADVCIVSDYAKGVVFSEILRAVVETARARGIAVIVDPKRRDMSFYRGATVITPNLLEFEAAVGHPCATTAELIAAAGQLLPSLEGGAMVVTRGAAGISLFEPGKPPVHTPSHARAVFDVTGAGDTVIGTLSLALTAGHSLAESIVIASAAAGLAVSKAGTATVSAAELREEATRLRADIEAVAAGRV